MTRKYTKHIKRIYHGPPGAETSAWWTVRVTNAKKPVTVNIDAASLSELLKGQPGLTVACGIAMLLMSEAVAKLFPHEVLFAAVTGSGAVIVDKLKNGLPSHGVKYSHCLARIVDANDTGSLKKLLREHPEIIERPFTFRPPHVHGTNGPGGGVSAGTARPRATFLPRGALKRAVRAGRVLQPIADQMKRIAGRKI